LQSAGLVAAVAELSIIGSATLAVLAIWGAFYNNDVLWLQLGLLLWCYLHPSVH
jgi:hypothetical protein